MGGGVRFGGSGFVLYAVLRGWMLGLAWLVVFHVLELLWGFWACFWAGLVVTSVCVWGSVCPVGCNEAVGVTLVALVDLLPPLGFELVFLLFEPCFDVGALAAWWNVLAWGDVCVPFTSGVVFVTPVAWVVVWRVAVVGAGWGWVWRLFGGGPMWRRVSVRPWAGLGLRFLGLGGRVCVCASSVPYLRNPLLLVVSC
ncbi:hypothetical protein [Corynebacterium diphtheriae]|uniref:hypothetical protein n=1 Tax=Corynebacterium diphtheriae TaxID=1717 RepID=UPI00114CC587|nr:hypothetical protein [Corynebacterium diphtheriae]